MKTLIYLPVFLLFVSCATTEQKDENISHINWQQYQEKQNQLQSWTIKGRLSVQTEYEGGQMDYAWQQHNVTDYDIALRAPMGAGTTIIRGRENSVRLQSPSGEKHVDTDVDSLVNRLNGWPLPVSSLQYWVRGIPAPTSSFEVVKWSKKNLPSVMEQEGWRIEFRRYDTEEGEIFLSKLFINRLEGEEVDVRLLIRQWIKGTEIK